jgi:hypothetical protein
MNQRHANIVINAHGKYPVYKNTAGVYQLELLDFMDMKVSYYAFAEPGKPYADYPSISRGIVNGIVNYTPTTRNQDLKDYIVNLQLQLSQQLIDEGVINEETGLRYAQAKFGNDSFSRPLDPHRTELWTIGNKCYNKIFNSFTQKEKESKFKQDSGVYFGYNNIGIEPGTLLFSSSICDEFSLDNVKNLCVDLGVTSVHIIDLTCSPFYDVENKKYIVDDTINLTGSYISDKDVIRSTRSYNKLLRDILGLADTIDEETVIVPTNLKYDEREIPFFAEYLQDIYLGRTNNQSYPEYVIPNYVLPKIYYELEKHHITQDIINRVFLEINNGKRDPIDTLREIKNKTINLPVIQYTPGPFTILPADSDKMEEGGGKYKSKKPTRKHKKYGLHHKLYRASNKYKSRKNKRKTRKIIKNSKTK